MENSRDFFKRIRFPKPRIKSSREDSRGKNGPTPDFEYPHRNMSNSRSLINSNWRLISRVGWWRTSSLRQPLPNFSPASVSSPRRRSKM